MVHKHILTIHLAFNKRLQLNVHAYCTLRAETLTQTFAFFSRIFKTNCINTHVFCDCKTWLCLFALLFTCVQHYKRAGLVEVVMGMENLVSDRAIWTADFSQCKNAFFTVIFFVAGSVCGRFNFYKF